MKQIWPFFSLVLITAPLAIPAVAAAEPVTLRAISVDARLDDATLVNVAYDKKDRDDRKNSGGNRQRANDRQGGDRQGGDRQNDDRQSNDRQGGDRQNNVQGANRSNGRQVQENRDNRINRAMSVASSRGRVLDAGPQGGSVFWVRVATDHGRVDLLVDADSGRIIGER